MNHNLMKLTGLSVCIALAFATQPIQAQTVQVIATQDSVDVMQGALRKVEVEVVQPSEMQLRWLSDPASPEQKIVELIPGVEVNWSSAIDTTRLGNDRLQLKRTLLVQPWDSGEYIIPGIALAAGNDTFLSKPVSLKVYAANIDTMTTIHTWMPPVEQKRHFWDWVPDWIADYWWGYVIALGLIAAAVVAYIFYRKGGLRSALQPEPKAVPPYEKAIAELQLLRGRQLCEKGREKEYYTDLTEILRQYLDGRFGINAMEMTTTQIKRAVYATVSEKSASAMMNDVLEMADYVKFAKMRPLPEDNMRAFNQALSFVENTKPAPEPDTQEKEASK